MFNKNIYLLNWNRVSGKIKQIGRTEIRQIFFDVKISYFINILPG